MTPPHDREPAAGVDLALFTDLYEFTMLQSYWEHDLHAPATFELFTRTLPEGRNYLLACGLESALTYLERLEFGAEARAALERVGFPAPFLDWLGELRFTGNVWAMPEGTPAFGNEPLLVVEAPMPEAQVVETYLINQVHFQTLVASKGARVVTAAAGRPVADFGGRRAHGTDAGLTAARALYLAGMASTSNVAAGARYGIPVTGTMAHSYVQAHGEDYSAFRDFVTTHPGDHAAGRHLRHARRASAPSSPSPGSSATRSASATSASTRSPSANSPSRRGASSTRAGSPRCASSRAAASTSTASPTSSPRARRSTPSASARGP